MHEAEQTSCSLVFFAIFAPYGSASFDAPALYKDTGLITYVYAMHRSVGLLLCKGISV